MAPVSSPRGTAKAPAYRCIHASALPFHWSSVTTPEETEALDRMMMWTVKMRVAPMTPQVKVRRLRASSARTRSHRPAFTAAFSRTLIRVCGCTAALTLMRAPPSQCGARLR